MQLGAGDNARRPLSGPGFANWSQSSGWPCPGHCTLSQCSPTWRWMTDWAPESSGVYAWLQPNNAGAKRSETGPGQLGWGKVCSLLLKCLCEDFGVRKRHPERISSILTCSWLQGDGGFTCKVQFTIPVASCKVEMLKMSKEKWKNNRICLSDTNPVAYH